MGACSNVGYGFVGITCRIRGPGNYNLGYIFLEMVDSTWGMGVNSSSHGWILHDTRSDWPILQW